MIHSVAHIALTAMVVVRHEQLQRARPAVQTSVHPVDVLILAFLVVITTLAAVVAFAVRSLITLFGRIAQAASALLKALGTMAISIVLLVALMLHH